MAHGSGDVVHRAREAWGARSPRVIIDGPLDVVGAAMGMDCLLALQVLTPLLKLLMIDLKVGLCRHEALQLLVKIGGPLVGA